MVLPYPLYNPSTSRVDEFPETTSPQRLLPQVQRTCVSDIFFSEENIAALQQGLRYKVYTTTQGKILVGNQSRDELAIIMRSIYLEHGRNLPHNLLEQVRDLNARVLDFAVPRVAREAQMFRTYMRDSTTQPVPLEYGKYTTRAGQRGGIN